MKRAIRDLSAVVANTLELERRLRQVSGPKVKAPTRSARWVHGW